MRAVLSSSLASGGVVAVLLGLRLEARGWGGTRDSEASLGVVGGGRWRRSGVVRVARRFLGRGLFVSGAARQTPLPLAGAAAAPISIGSVPGMVTPVQGARFLAASCHGFELSQARRAGSHAGSRLVSADVAS